MKKNFIPEKRRKILKDSLNSSSRALRVIECHNGLSAIIGNDVKVDIEKNDSYNEIGFDALWISSFTDSSAKGYPDADIVGFDSRLATINQILDVTDKPVIVDGDTGGDPNQFEYMVKALERLGVSAVIIEDKVFPKRNSLDAKAIQHLENPEVFANKINRGKSVLSTEEFMVIARLESLIAGTGIEDAVSRAKTYLKAGADGIMIHSKATDPEDVIEFSKRYKKLCSKLGINKPLVCVPTTYNTITETELYKYGFKVVIYANHLLRTACQSMESVAKLILSHGRSFEVNPYCVPVEAVFKKVGFQEIKEKDAADQKKLKRNIPVIIPAAGEHKSLSDVLKGTPCCMLDIKGKSLLERQVETLKKCNLDQIIAIRGYNKKKVSCDRVKFFDNDEYQNTSILHSLFKAEEEMHNGFIFTYSDILFDEEIIKKILGHPDEILVVGDGSFRYHKHEVDKKLDLIISAGRKSSLRELKKFEKDRVKRIGKKIDASMAQYEFIGIAYFSPKAAEELINVYHDCLKYDGRFHEASSINKASINDLLQEMVDRNYRVNILEVHKGWAEIHNHNDYKRLIEEL